MVPFFRWPFIYPYDSYNTFKKLHQGLHLRYLTYIYCKKDLRNKNVNQPTKKSVKFAPYYFMRQMNSEVEFFQEEFFSQVWYFI